MVTAAPPNPPPSQFGHSVVSREWFGINFLFLVRTGRLPPPPDGLKSGSQRRKQQFFFPLLWLREMNEEEEEEEVVVRAGTGGSVD